MRRDSPICVNTGATALTDAEERVFIKKVQQDNDPKSLERLVVQYHPLLCKMVTHLDGYNFDRQDLYQEGMVGLISSIKRFDLDAQHRLGVFARPWIISSMYQYVANNWNIVRSCTTKERKQSFFKNKGQFAVHKGDIGLCDNTSVESHRTEHNLDREGLFVTLKYSILFLFMSIGPKERYIFVCRHLLVPALSLRTLSEHINISSEKIRQIDHKSMMLLKSIAKKLQASSFHLQTISR